MADATAYWFCADWHLLSEEFSLPAILRKAGWGVRERQLLLWYRPNGPGAKHRGNGQVWARMSEHILMLTKGKGLGAKPSGLPESERQPWYHNVLPVPTPQSNTRAGRWHVCQKPVRLYKLLLQAHQGVGRVLDPTVGSGSSLVACAELGLADALGIEIVPETADLARARVAAAESGQQYRAARGGTAALFKQAREAE